VVTVDEPAAGLIPTLRGRYYIDPGIFSAEQAAIFESLWFCAMRSADVAGPGGFRTVADRAGERDRGPGHRR